MCTPPYSLRRLYLSLFLSANVRIILYRYIHTPTPAWCPPPCSKHTQESLVCMLTNTHTLQKKTQTKEKEKTERECSWGDLGESAVVGGTGYICKCSRIVYLKSLHTCLDKSNNGMFQRQSSKDNDNPPNVRIRAHVRMETCLPRAHLFMCWFVATVSS